MLLTIITMAMSWITLIVFVVSTAHIFTIRFTGTVGVIMTHFTVMVMDRHGLYPGAWDGAILTMVGVILHTVGDILIMDGVTHITDMDMVIIIHTIVMEADTTAGVIMVEDITTATVVIILETTDTNKEGQPEPMYTEAMTEEELLPLQLLHQITDEMVQV